MLLLRPLNRNLSAVKAGQKDPAPAEPAPCPRLPLHAGNRSDFPGASAARKAGGSGTGHCWREHKGEVESMMNGCPQKNHTSVATKPSMDVSCTTEQIQK